MTKVTLPLLISAFTISVDAFNRLIGIGLHTQLDAVGVWLIAITGGIG
jgi:hypothetical protein